MLVCETATVQLENGSQLSSGKRELKKNMQLLHFPPIRKIQRGSIIVYPIYHRRVLKSIVIRAPISLILYIFILLSRCLLVEEEKKKDNIKKKEEEEEIIVVVVVV